MRIQLDAKADALYITLSEKPYAFGRDVDDSRRIDYAADGTVIGVEILFPSLGVRLEGLPLPDGVVRELRNDSRLALVA
jgi:uncharacterized protein YuzE